MTPDPPPPAPTTIPADPATAPPDPTATADYDPDRTNPARTAPTPVAPPGYVLDGELGRGGFGVVFKAVQRSLNRPVALKMILTADLADHKDLLRFLAEAETVAAIKHPHVIDVYEFGEQQGRPFLAMEFCPGGSLADRLRRGPLTPTAAAELVGKLARAVHTAHDAGVVHRDLKPGNVLFDSGGEPRVSDFGLAKRAGKAELTRTGAVMGTPAYMAPEQASGNTKFVGPAADVYALGVILFECLTGRRPFDDPDPVALILKVANEDAPPPRRVAPHVPKDLDRVCQKCLAKDPADRYPTAAALADDLARFLAGETVTAARPSVFDRVRATLDRGKHAAEFAEYANIFFWLAGLTLVGEIVNTLCVQEVLPPYVIRVNNYLRVLALVGLLAYYRRGHVLPQTAMERYLWAVWGGYLVCCFMNGVAHWLRPGWDWSHEAELYQTNALLTALAFFALAPAFWGWCYAFGAAFLGLSLLMAFDLRWAPLLFGAAWAVVLVLIGLRLRRLAKPG